MSIYDGKHIFHKNADEYHKKEENIDITNKHIINQLSTCQSLQSVINVEYMINYMYNSLAETLFWEYDTTYRKAFFHTEANYDNSTTKVSLLYVQSLSGDNSTQSNSNLQPKLSQKLSRINNRYYLQFDGINRMISDIDLNKQGNHDDIVHALIVYRVKSYTGGYWRLIH